MGGNKGKAPEPAHFTPVDQPPCKNGLEAAFDAVLQSALDNNYPKPSEGVNSLTVGAEPRPASRHTDNGRDINALGLRAIIGSAAG